MPKFTGQGENLSKLWVRTSINGPAVQKKQDSQYLLIHTDLSENSDYYSFSKWTSDKRGCIQGYVC